MNHTNHSHTQPQLKYPSHLQPHPQAPQNNPQPQPISPHSQQISPHPQQISPHPQQISPHPQPISPHPQQASPHPQQTNPYPQPISPHPQQASTHTQQASTHTQQANPYPQQASPHPQQTSPHPQQASPHPQQASPHPQQANPYPQQASPPPQQASPPPQQASPPPQQTNIPIKRPILNKNGLLQAGSILSFWAEAADLLLTSDQGDAALLYLHILRKGHGVPKEWTLSRTTKAQNALQAMGLFDASQCANEPPPTHDPLPSNGPPSYSRKDLAMRCSDSKNGFSDLLARTEKQMGALLSDPQKKVLLELYEHVGLHPPIITMLIQWVISRHEQTAGEGQRPPFDKIKKEGYHWNKMGVTTVERADSYMIEENKLNVWEAKVLSALHIYSRELTDSEREVCALWYKWGMHETLVEYAYQRNVEQIGNFSWPYVRKIIKDWHDNGFTTIKEIKQFDTNFASRPKVPRGGTSQTKSGPRIGQPSQNAAASQKSDLHSQQDKELLLRSIETFHTDHDPNNHQ